MPDQNPSPAGRNDPCPCGSGKKLKKCCGRAGAGPGPGASSVAATRVPAINRGGDAAGLAIPHYFTMEDRVSAVTMLAEFASGGNFGTQHAACIEAFFEPLLKVFDAAPDNSADAQALLEAMQTDPISKINLDAFFMFDQALEGRTILELFLEEHGAKMTPGEHCYLEALQDSALRLYEIEAIDADGMRVRDLWDDEVQVVAPCLQKDAVAVGNTPALRVLKGPDGRGFVEIDVYPFKTWDGPTLLASVRRYHEVWCKEGRSRSSADFFKQMSGSMFGPLFVESEIIGSMDGVESDASSAETEQPS